MFKRFIGRILALGYNFFLLLFIFWGHFFGRRQRFNAVKKPLDLGLPSYSAKTNFSQLICQNEKQNYLCEVQNKLKYMLSFFPHNTDNRNQKSHS